MILHKVAHNYALALSQVAGLNLEQAEADLEAVRELVRSDVRFSIFLESPSIGREAKKKAFMKALEGKVQKAVLITCLILIEHRRTQFIAEVFEAFRNIVDDILGRTYVEVTVAKALESGEQAIDKALQESVIQKLDANRSAFGLKANKELHYTVKSKVNSELLAGIKMRVGDYIFDGTVARNLVQWRDVAVEHPLAVENAFSE